MADAIEELIREIATKHGIAVSRDDPILILQTINARLMEDSAGAQQEMLSRFKEEMEDLALRWGTDTKIKAERVLNVSLNASAGAMTKMMQEGTAEIAEAMSRQVDSSLMPIVQHINDARHIGIINILASCITLAAVLVAVWG